MRRFEDMTLAQWAVSPERERDEKEIDRMIMPSLMEGIIQQQEPERPALPATTDLRKWIKAGNATFTLRSQRTGKRFTFKVQKSRPNPKYPRPCWFIKVLTGPDNTAHYRNLGRILDDDQFIPGNEIAPTALSMVTFNWFWQKLRRGEPLTGKADIFHEGRCCRCGRALTVPESVESGIGPECASKL